jgi:hypothetical protein
MKLFRDDNTEGYTPDELDALNAEWEQRVEDLELDKDSEEYDTQAKAFSDEVSSR